VKKPLIALVLLVLAGCGGRYGYNPLYSEPHNPCAGECVRTAAPELERDLQQFAAEVDRMIKELETGKPAKKRTPVSARKNETTMGTLFDRLYR